MNNSNLIHTAGTILFVVGLVAYRLIWAASQATAGAGLGQTPRILPKKWLRWLFGESNKIPTK